MSASYVIKTNARSVLTRFTVSGLIPDYIADPAKGPPGEVSKENLDTWILAVMLSRELTKTCSVN